MNRVSIPIFLDRQCRFLRRHDYDVAEIDWWRQRIAELAEQRAKQREEVLAVAEPATSTEEVSS